MIEELGCLKQPEIWKLIHTILIERSFTGCRISRGKNYWRARNAYGVGIYKRHLGRQRYGADCSGKSIRHGEALENSLIW